ncbi:CDP-alcohol phosphatidyltransferase family protein [Desulfosporosinus meridiei]|uniref:Phosphatidylserine synthase n=1 Tax=Desulfosporosinus meridiei (strain ATCC BAA-275 / DSM 13257 / KCTC 12902 / NCIMB 13706 / S10) TaxID=768704 RepID=J7IW03_DESMD|nr:CDP-alcohol phosphatidyltransferase family protein [Desulfosporosinus meridiei]AFQ44319.1 phosphatidylserine synthase [Desulfosporosinus meridiei DSM 13257]
MKRKFVYLKYLNIPNTITGCSLAIGFISLTLIFQQELKLALTLYAFTLLLDRLDGIAARKFGMESDFGKELDSLADFFNFCIVPAIISYFLGVNSVLSVLILIAYILSGVSRLAHFNLEGMEEIEGKKYFSGIPTTLAASWFLITLSLLELFNLRHFHAVLPLFFGALAVLMIAPLQCNKNGLLVKSLYLLIPTVILCLWLF